MSAYVQDLKTLVSSSPAASVNVGNLTAAPTPGNTLTLEIVFNGSDTIATSAGTVTDTKGNTWTNVTSIVGTGSPVVKMSVWYTNQDVAPLTTSDHVTVAMTHSNGTVFIAAIREFAGKWVLDKTVTSNVTTAATSITTGTTAATTASTEFALASYGLGVNEASWTKDTNYTLPTNNNLGTATQSRALLSQYRDLAATGTQVAAATIPTSTVYVTSLATFRQLKLITPASANDVFNRADENPLSGGGVWTTQSGKSAWQLSTNQVIPSSSTLDCHSIYTGRTWAADHYSQAVYVAAGSSGGEQGAGLGVRMAPGANTYYRLTVDHAASNNCAIRACKAGVSSVILTFTQAWTNGDTWKLQVVGNTLTAYLNGSLVASVTDSAGAGPASGGGPGLTFSSTETGCIMDSWSGGDISSTGLRGTTSGILAAQGTSIPVNFPAAAQVGDYAFLFVNSNNATVTFNTPAGWTVLPGMPLQSSFGTTLAGFYRVVDGTEGSSVTVSITGATARSLAGVIVVYSNVGGIDQTTTYNSGAAGSTSAAFSALTNTKANELTVAAVGWSGGSAVSPTATQPGGWIERQDVVTAIAAVSESLVEVSDFIFGAAGSTGAFTTTVGNSGALVGIAISLLSPAPVAAIAATATVSGAVTKGGGTKPVGTGTVNATSTMGGAVTRTAAITPAQINATSTVSGKVVAIRAIIPTVQTYSQLNSSYASYSAVQSAYPTYQFILASILAISTVSGAIGKLKPLGTGSISATSTVSGSVRVTRRVTPAQISATSTVSGAVVALRKITAAQVSATSTVSGSIRVTRRVAPAQISATSTVSGNVLRRAGILPTTISATSTVSGTLIKVSGVVRPVSGTINATSTVAGAVTRKVAVKGTISATSTVSGAVLVRRGILPTTISATSTVSGTIRRIAGILPAQISATSTVSGLVQKLRPITAAAIAATSTVSGSIVVRRAVRPAQISATSTVSGSIIRRAAVAGVVNATSTVSGAVRVIRGVLPAVISATSTVSGAVRTTHRVSGNINAISTFSGNVIRKGQIGGLSVAATSTVSGNIRVTRKVAPTLISATSTVAGSIVVRRAVRPLSIAATSTVSGALIVTRAVRPAQISATSTVSGTLGRLRPILPAAIQAVSSLSGALRVRRAVTGQIAAISALSGSLRVRRGVLPGQINATSTVQGAIVRIVHLRGTISATSTVSGVVLKARPVAGNIFATSTLSGGISVIQFEVSGYFPTTLLAVGNNTSLISVGTSAHNGSSLLSVTSDSELISTDRNGEAVLLEVEA